MSQMMPDVVAFITAKDIPGANNYGAFLANPEEVRLSVYLGNWKSVSI